MTTDDICEAVVVSERAGDEADSLAERLVCAVAAASNTVPTELPPLQHHVDAAALAALYERRDTPGPTVSFDFAGFRVSIAPDAMITLYETRALDVESATD